MMRQQDGAALLLEFQNLVGDGRVDNMRGQKTDDYDTFILPTRDGAGTIMEAVRVLLVSTYEMGRQPFGLASPAAWLRADGHEVTQADLSCSPMPGRAVESAGLIAFFLPMHTATRLFLRLVDRVRAANPRAHLCAYGLYAPLNERLLRGAGVGTILGGEFEAGTARPGAAAFRAIRAGRSAARR